MKYVPIIIPAYEPDKRMIELCKELYMKKIKDVIIVNDGSNSKFNSIFKKIEKEYNYTILKHDINLGKGRALKTAFNYLLTRGKEIKGCVTVDCDGQHAVTDIIKCVTIFLENPDCLVLGCRDFSKPDVPWKSKNGNNITKNVFKLFCGLKISDTQTGLRVIPKKFMSELLGVTGERFEFETNMLIESKDKYKIMEVEIDTIYDSKENHSTHFNPIVDSFKIYKLIFKTFFKYIFSAASSFIIDILLFSLFVLIFKEKFINSYILLSTVLARIFSSIYNYTINYKFVFKSNSSKKTTSIQYFSLVIIQMIISAISVTLLSNLFIKINETLIKAIVDSVLFFISFFVQKLYIFKNHNI